MTDNLIGGMDIKDLGFIAIGNIGSKMVVSRFVGDNRLTSGAVKVVGSVALGYLFKNDTINKIALGVAVDGLEDLAVGSGLLGGIQGFVGGVQEGIEI